MVLSVEASIATKSSHERKCPYIHRIRTWHNPDSEDVDGFWPVDRVPQLRGPPSSRYVQLIFAPPDLEADVDNGYEFTDLMRQTQHTPLPHR